MLLYEMTAEVLSPLELCAGSFAEANGALVLDGKAIPFPVIRIIAIGSSTAEFDQLPGNLVYRRLGFGLSKVKCSVNFDVFENFSVFFALILVVLRVTQTSPDVKTPVVSAFPKSP